MSPHLAFLLGAVTLALIGSGLAGLHDALQATRPRRERRRLALIGANLTGAGALLAIHALNVWGTA